MIELRIKKAAMFGLDARIALAIFGALSVISGAALYSSIQSAKAESWRQNFEEIVKASEQYYLDNGRLLPEHDTFAHQIEAGNLIDNIEGLQTWSGAYIHGTRPNNSTSFSTTLSRTFDSSYFNIYIMPKSDWATPLNINFCVVDSYDCMEYVVLRGNSVGDAENIREMFDTLDASIDNSDGVLTGKVRFIDKNNTDFIAFQGMQRKRID